jgi:hypothetical protein
MNLNVLQIQSLSSLVESVETLIALYWDTDNGAKLSQSLQAFRAAFRGTSLRQIDSANSSKARLVVEAHCPACGFLNDDPQADGLSNISLALEHASAHGHVVILNGTADLPPAKELRPTLIGCSGSNDSI